MNARSASYHLAWALSVWVPFAVVPAVETDPSTYGTLGWAIGVLATWAVCTRTEGGLTPSGADE